MDRIDPRTELVPRTVTGEAGAGTQKHAGEYTITYELGKPSPFYEFADGKLEKKEPSEENVELAVRVTDDEDRLIPGLSVHATFLDKKGGRAATTSLPFLWAGKDSCYAANLKVPPGKGHLLQVHVSPPTFSRTKQRFVEGADVQFENVDVE